jgi:hypothetical protein
MSISYIIEIKFSPRWFEVTNSYVLYKISPESTVSKQNTIYFLRKLFSLAGASKISPPIH